MVQHALCIISQHPAWKSLRECLVQIYQEHGGRLNSRIEQSVHHILRAVRANTRCAKPTPC